MKGKLRPDSENPGAEKVLRAAFDAMRQQRGGCPDAGTLARFLDGGLSEEQRSSVGSHIASCGFCDLAVSQMRQFEQTFDMGEDAPVPLRWSRIERNLDRRMRGLLDAGKPRPFWGAAVSVFRDTADYVFAALRKPMVAYALLLLLLYPAYLGIVQIRHPAGKSTASSRGESGSTTVVVPPPSLPAPMPALIVNLDRVRGEKGGGHAGAVPNGVNLVVLQFFWPVRLGATYSGQIKDATGRVVVPVPDLTSSDSKGNFSLVCERKYLPPGNYTLTVVEKTPRETVPRQFSFPFSL